MLANEIDEGSMAGGLKAMMCSRRRIDACAIFFIASKDCGKSPRSFDKCGNDLESLDASADASPQRVNATEITE
jgi:hypothetical protein